MKIKGKFKGIKLRRRKPRATGRKPRRLKYISVLPTFITLMNGVCGFLAIVISSRSPETRWHLDFMDVSGISPYTLAAYLIFVAMFADMMDGRVARLTRTTSSFGGQLDSLSDVISFGAAPAFIMIKLVEYHITYVEMTSVFFSMHLGRLVIFSAIFYVMCTVLRLARFNVENIEDESAHMDFSGIPSPGAAGVVASLVVFQQQILPGISAGDIAGLSLANFLTVLVLPITTLLMGILMVSRVSYPHIANKLLRGKKSLPVIMLFFAAILISIWNIQLVLVLCFCGFALFGIFRWIISGLFRKRDKQEAKE